MPVITLPDQTQLSFESPISVLKIAESIGASLAKAALAGEIAGKLVDLSYSIDRDVPVKLITSRDEEGLSIIRHSTAHLMAQAVKALFPTAQVTIGPVIENGFYYDFAFERSFTLDDLKAIEERMKSLAKAALPIERIEIARDEAVSMFTKMGEHYKVQIINDLPETETISLYKQGDFIDLCRGPHVPNTSHLKAFKLTKVAGAYWRGDSKNEMLQRIYAVAFTDKKALNAYLKRLEEAEKRDHRRLGKLMDLFHFQQEAPGMAFWHGNGWKIYQSVIAYMRKKLSQYDYEEVAAPLMADRILWEKSGHWDKFGQSGMFTTESENRTYVIKPMNCPGHIQIYNQGVKSYRDLPLKMGEFGMCHRNEASGTLHGLMRIREFTQDDAHVFCTKEQLADEINTLIHIVYEIYHDFGFDSIIVRLATRPEKRIGADSVWDESEKALEQALNQRGINWTLAPGEGAFYGPKIEFHLKDCLDRIWQCGTIQVDFSMPERLGAEYVAEDGSRQTPIMIHRAILGSIERFIGILLEHYAGKLPIWLAPTQVVVMNITDQQAEYVHVIVKNLKKIGIRVKSDLRNEKIGYKIRQHTLSRIPYQLVIGDREVADETVAVRGQDDNTSEVMGLQAFIELIRAQLAV